MTASSQKADASRPVDGCGVTQFSLREFAKRDGATVVMIGEDGAEQVPVGGGRIGRDHEDLQASTLHGAFYRGRADDQASSLSSLRDEHGEGRRRERFRREMPS